MAGWLSLSCGLDSIGKYISRNNIISSNDDDIENYDRVLITVHNEDRN